MWGGAIAGVSPDEDQLPFSADVAEAPLPRGAGLASPELPSPRGGRGCTTRVTRHRGPKVRGGSIYRELAGLYQDLRRGQRDSLDVSKLCLRGNPAFQN